jgi:hypothetical protein
MDDCDLPLEQHHKIDYPTGKGLEKVSRKSLEKSLRWKTSFKASKSFKR